MFVCFLIKELTKLHFACMRPLGCFFFPKKKKDPKGLMGPMGLLGFFCTSLVSDPWGVFFFFFFVFQRKKKHLQGSHTSEVQFSQLFN